MTLDAPSRTRYPAGMRPLALLLLACAPAFAEDPSGAADNFDTVVRGYVARRSGEDGAWALKRKGSASPLRLRYDEVERATVHPLGEGDWRGLAAFTDDATRKHYHADVVVSMGGESWEVKRFSWTTAAQLGALRSAFAKAAKTPAPAGASRAPLPEALRANAEGFYDPSRDAKADIAAAVAEARRTGRRVLLQAGSAGCGWCKRLRALFEQDAELEALKRKSFVPVLVDVHANAGLWKGYGPVPGTPHFFVLDGEGRVLHAQNTEEFEAGPGYDRDKVAVFLADWAPAD